MHVFTTRECEFMCHTVGVPCACGSLSPLLVHKSLVASHCREAFMSAFITEHIPRVSCLKLK